MAQKARCGTHSAVAGRPRATLASGRGSQRDPRQRSFDSQGRADHRRDLSLALGTMSFEWCGKRSADRAEV